MGTTHGTPLLRTDFLIKDVVVTLLCKIKAKGKSVDNGMANNAFALTARQLPTWTSELGYSIFAHQIVHPSSL